MDRRSGDQSTAAAVTQQVARAERDCGAPLVRRGPRGASLTAAGAVLVVLPDDHPLAARVPADAAVRLDQLRDDAWVTILAGHAARAQFDRAAAAAGFTPAVRFQTESYDVAQALVGTGIGVAVVSRLALTNAPGTTHRRLAKRGLHRRVYAATLADSTLTPLVAAFVRLLRDVADDMSAEAAADAPEGEPGQEPT